MKGGRECLMWRGRVYSTPGVFTCRAQDRLPHQKRGEKSQVPLYVRLFLNGKTMNVLTVSLLANYLMIKKSSNTKLHVDDRFLNLSSRMQCIHSFEARGQEYINLVLTSKDIE